jgi:NAD(P)-dependent dehydrogenase (short-subunit alcohol dehydrogenase family)
MSRRLIVLTGVTRGLGRALVPFFVEAGHTVIGCGRSSRHLTELSGSFAKPHSFTSVDVADWSSVELWTKSILASHGTPDLLINNAAVINTPRPLWEMPADEFDRLIDVNIKGVANLIRAFVPSMTQAKRGVVVNLSSGWGRSTAPNVAAYCATKYAIEGLTLALAQELPAGMAAIPLNPGIIDTEMLRLCFPDGASSYPKADVWAKRAAPFLLGLTAKDSGKSLSVPEHG